MTEVTAAEHIACPPELAFELLADLRRVTRAELLSEEPIGPGSRFLVGGDRRYDAAIVSFAPPSRLVFEATGWFDVTATFTFGSARGGTDFVARFVLRPRGAARLALPLARRRISGWSAAFKDLCESTT